MTIQTIIEMITVKVGCKRLRGVILNLLWEEPVTRENNLIVVS